MVGNLHTAQAELGPEASKVQIIAVSVDPRGDTPKTVKAFLRAHQMTGRMEYLIGSRPQLEKVWRDWSILAKATPTQGRPRRGRALGTGLRDQRQRAGSPRSISTNFTPQQIVHDVPILASE